MFSLLKIRTASTPLLSLFEIKTCLNLFGIGWYLFPTETVKQCQLDLSWRGGNTDERRH